jgi:IS30 family transposase
VVWAVAERYGATGRREKGRILDELTATTGWHRKHAVRALSAIGASRTGRLQAKTIPNELYRPLTWDRGKELADHRRFTLATNVDVYFCDPQSPWQRGSNENTHGLLRQYFLKGTDLSVYTQAQKNRVARQLNERPRKTLGFQTPAERFSTCVASIA